MQNKFSFLVMITAISVLLLSLFSSNLVLQLSYSISPDPVQNLPTQKYDGTKGYLTIRFDDTDTTKIQALTNVTKFGFPGVWAISPGLVGGTGRPTWTQITNLYHAGIEIDSHSYTHFVVSQFTPQSVLIHQIVDSKTAIQSHGIKVFGFMPPQGKITTNSSVLINKNYNYSGVAGAKQNTLFSIANDGKRYGITIPAMHAIAVNGGSGTLQTFDQVKAQIVSSETNHTWLVLKFHKIGNPAGSYTTTPQLFWKILQYVKNQSDIGNIKVVSHAQGLGFQ